MGVGVFGYAVSFCDIACTVEHKAVIDLNDNNESYYPQIDVPEDACGFFAFALAHDDENYHCDERCRYAENGYHNKYLAERERENRGESAVGGDPQRKDMRSVPIAERRAVDGCQFHNDRTENKP